jgi:hypothetical protein
VLNSQAIEENGQWKCIKEPEIQSTNRNISVSIGLNTNKTSRIEEIFVYDHLLMQLEIGDQVPKTNEVVS